MKKNLFIAFEGIDGSGKSTQVKLLNAKLKEAGHKVYTTFEPTGGPVGSMIRDIFNRRMEADDRVIAGLFVADRLDHLLNKSNGIIKKLNEGFTVITDRYYFSSYAYHAAHMPMEWVINANALSADLLRPDLNVYIDVPPEISMERLARGRESMEIYETLENLRKVRDKYMEAFQLLKDREKVFIVNGNRQTEDVAGDIWKEIKKLVEERNTGKK